MRDAALPPETAAPARTAVLLCNLGTPDAPTAPAVRRYLAEFLSDPRVVELPRALWLPVLHAVVLRVRPAASARRYRAIWTPLGSPLAVWTARQAEALGERLAAAPQPVTVRHAMRYGRPSIGEVLDALKACGHARVLVLPLYPQYAASTTASVCDAVYRWALRQRRIPEFRFVGDYHDDAGYVEAAWCRIDAHWQAHGRPDRLVLSFHGIPARAVAQGDPYREQCLRTAELIAARTGLDAGHVVVTFQSRFGKAEWLRPYTDATLAELARQGVGRVDVMCPGFTSDCLETLEEIAVEARETFLRAGGREFHAIACLNDAPAWIDALAAIAARHLQGWSGATDG